MKMNKKITMALVALVAVMMMAVPLIVLSDDADVAAAIDGDAAGWQGANYGPVDFSAVAYGHTTETAEKTASNITLGNEISVKAVKNGDIWTYTVKGTFADLSGTESDAKAVWASYGPGEYIYGLIIRMSDGQSFAITKADAAKPTVLPNGPGHIFYADGAWKTQGLKIYQMVGEVITQVAVLNMNVAEPEEELSPYLIVKDKDDAQHVGDLASFKAALEIGGTVVMDTDIEIDEEITVGAGVTLDINFHSLIISGDGKLVIDGGKVVGENVQNNNEESISFILVTTTTGVAIDVKNGGILGYKEFDAGTKLSESSGAIFIVGTPNTINNMVNYIGAQDVTGSFTISGATGNVLTVGGTTIDAPTAAKMVPRITFNGTGAVHAAKNVTMTDSMEISAYAIFHGLTVDEGQTLTLKGAATTYTPDMTGQTGCHDQLVLLYGAAFDCTAGKFVGMVNAGYDDAEARDQMVMKVLDDPNAPAGGIDGAVSLEKAVGLTGFVLSNDEAVEIYGFLGGVDCTVTIADMTVSDALALNDGITIDEAEAVLTVDEGAVFTVKTGATATLGTLTVNGTVKVQKEGVLSSDIVDINGADDAIIVNDGEVSFTFVSAKMNWTVNGTVTVADDFTIDDGERIIVLAGKTLKVASEKTLTLNGGMMDCGTVKNAGTIVIKGDVQVWNGGVITKDGSANGTVNITNTNAEAIRLRQGTIEYQNIALPGITGKHSIVITHDGDSDLSRGNAVFQYNTVNQNGDYGVLVEIMENMGATSDVTLTISNNTFVSDDTVKTSIQIGSGAGQVFADKLKVVVKNNDFTGIHAYADAADKTAVRILAKDVTIGTAASNIVSVSDGVKLGINCNGSATLKGDLSYVFVGLAEGSELVIDGGVLKATDLVMNAMGDVSTVNGGKMVFAVGATMTCGAAVCIGETGLNISEGTIEVVSAGEGLYDFTIDGTASLNVSYNISAGAQVTVSDKAQLNISKGKTLTVDDGAVLMVNGTVILDKDETAGGKLVVTSSVTKVVGEAGVCGTGVVIVESGAEYTLGIDKNECWFTACDTKVMYGGTLTAIVGAYGSVAGEPIIPSDSSAGETEKYVLISHKKASGTYWTYTDGLIYSLFENVAFDETHYVTTFEETLLQPADSMFVKKGMIFTLTGDIEVPETATFVIEQTATAVLDTNTSAFDNHGKMTVEGTLDTNGNTFYSSEKGTIDVGSKGKIIGGGDYNFSDAAMQSKVLFVSAGGVLTVTLDSTGDDKAEIKLELVAAGTGGITVKKGSVYIDGIFVPAGADGTITIPDGSTAHVTGTVESGVTLIVPATSTISIPDNAVLEFAAGSTFTNSGDVQYGSATSALIYDQGSVVNGAYIEVNTKVTKDGTQVAIVIYLLSQNDDKLEIDTPFVMAFSDATYGEILSMVNVEPQKSYVVFDGWYNTAMNEKITMGTKVLPYDHSITAKFTEEKRVPVPSGDDITPSQTVVIDGTSSSGMTDFALPIAIVCLICSVLALGFIVMRRR